LVVLILGGDDVQQLCEAGEGEFLEIMDLVGMASKPMHVRRLQKALQEWVQNPGNCFFSINIYYYILLFFLKKQFLPGPRPPLSRAFCSTVTANMTSQKMLDFVRTHNVNLSILELLRLVKSKPCNVSCSFKLIYTVFLAVQILLLQITSVGM
jgi:hypothetical protein